MTDLIASAFKNSLGLQLLHWAVSQSDIWHLTHRCSELVQHINEPLTKRVFAINDNNSLSMDEDDCILTGMHNLQQIYFDGENGEELDEFYDPQNNHIRCPDLKISNQFGELTIQFKLICNYTYNRNDILSHYYFPK